MKKITKHIASILTVAVVIAAVTPELALARAGGGRSFGSRGSRSYSSPSRTYSSPTPGSASPYGSQTYRPSTSPNPYSSSYPQTTGGGGFWRSMAGGVLGGMVGGMLFRSLGFGGGWGGGFGGGIGLFDILLLAGVGYMLFRFLRPKRPLGSTFDGERPFSMSSLGGGRTPFDSLGPSFGGGGSFGPSGLQAIAQTDPTFSEPAFREWCTDAFFRIQAAWMHRDLGKLHPLLTEEMERAFEKDIGELKAKGQTNRLENITVRSVDVTEAWQEAGQDYVTVRYLANLLDYSIEDSSGRILSGSDTEPVKFEEFWTWVCPTGTSEWKLSAINQAD